MSANYSQEHLTQAAQTKQIPDHDHRIGPKDRRKIPSTPATDRRETNIVNYITRQMRIRNYSGETIKAYKNILLDFSRYFDSPLREITNEQIDLYLSYLVEIRKVSASRINQAISAIKFLYGDLYDRKLIVEKLNRPRPEHQIPTVLNREDIIKIVDSITNPKHKLAIQLMYSSGFRVSEVVHRRVKNIDLQNLIIFVRQGKGKKDRITILSKKLIQPLEKIMENKNAESFLFESEQTNTHLSERSLQKIFQKALQKSGIQKEATCHTLRHSFATHLLESGVDLTHL